jgi:hypothetical protein
MKLAKLLKARSISLINYMKCRRKTAIFSAISFWAAFANYIKIVR